VAKVRIKRQAIRKTPLKKKLIKRKVRRMSKGRKCGKVDIRTAKIKTFKVRRKRRRKDS
jgi:hypothetical protein